MPLPDALPDRRIYELLKTVDLENLTFADLQSVGQTIFAEQGAEDELRRLVLVNLARMSIAGEWTGLTSAGGSAAIAALPNTTTATAPDNDWFILHQDPLFGSVIPQSTSTVSLSNLNNTKYWPFYVGRSGTVTELSVYRNAADTLGCDLEVGIYESTDGLPTNLLGKATMDMSGTGVVTQTSFSATITLTEGELYYYGAVRTQSSSDGTLRAANTSYSRFLNVGQSITSIKTGWEEGGTTTVLPSPATVTDSTSRARINCALVIT